MDGNRFSRREVVRGVVGAGLGVMVSPWLAWGQSGTEARAIAASNGPEKIADGAGRKILFFTKSAGFPHEMVTRKAGETMAFAERLLDGLATRSGYDVTVSKDGGVFEAGSIEKFDGFVFYTTGDLTKEPTGKYKSDQTPVMTAAGKKALLAAIENGKGFVGLHCANDTFLSESWKNVVRPEKVGEEIDPYIAMLGGEFLSHGSQQNATVRVVDGGFGKMDVKEFTWLEEWYAPINLAPDLHVILVTDTATMKKNAAGQREWQYDRAPFPNTWARRQGKGRVFYTAMGHRQDVWENEVYQRIVMAGLGWSVGAVEAEVTPNLEMACAEMMDAARKGVATTQASVRPTPG